jgi:hypothetical protein
MRPRAVNDSPRKGQGLLAIGPGLEVMVAEGRRPGRSTADAPPRRRLNLYEKDRRKASKGAVLLLRAYPH